MKLLFKQRSGKGNNILRLTLFIFFLSSLTLSGLAQNIQFSKNSLTLKEALEIIEKQTEMSVDYDNSVLNEKQRITIQTDNQSLENTLKEVLKESGCTYVIRNNHIIISKESRNQQQNQPITGTIYDNHGETVIGANVVVKGTTNGTITDIDGKFYLNVPENAVLQISYIGYMAQDVTVKGKTNLTITLREDAQNLDEVVVVGYGVQKKRDLTGAISSIKMDDAPVGTFSTISHALAGKAAGLQITQNSAQVGGGATFRIRGATSTGAGNDPLIIIDGFPVNSTSSLESGNRYDAGQTDNILDSLNPNDIESIEVLKDASSTAIYGSRAGHGVIIITTKRGKQQKATVTYSGNMSVQNMKNGYDMLDSREYMQQRNRYNYEMYMKANALGVYKDYITLDPNHIQVPYAAKYTEEDMRNPHQTNWFDEVTRTGFQQSHNVSLNGGTESTQYMASLNYMEQKGVIQNNNMERLTAKVNLDQTISRYVKTGLSFQLSRNHYDNVPIGNSDWENAGIIVSAVRFSPIIPVRDSEGNYSPNPDLSQLPNPVSLLEITDKTTRDRFLGSVYAQVEPTKGLILKAVLGVDRKYQKRKNYLPRTTLYGAAVNGQASIYQDDAIDYLMDLTANYVKEFRNHSITALVGYSYQQFNHEGVNAGNQDFLIDGFLYNNLAAGTYAKPTVGSFANKNALGSYFARINYSFMNRYLLTATVRADGASNFHPDNRWGYFPSISAGWRFSDEEFMSPFSNILSNGKLRISYGQTGNSNVGYRIFDTYEMGRYSYAFGSTGYMGVHAEQIGNSRLTWETTSEFNLGLDLGFLNNRISASVEYYNRTISDLLVVDKRLLSYNEIDQIAANIGKTQGQGFEFTLNTVNINKKDFYWSTDLSLALYRDKWKERDPNWKPAVYQSEKDPIRAVFDYLSDGLLQPGEKAPAHQPNLLPGQVKLQDLNKDGKIDDNDKVFLGTTDPGLLLGMNNSVNYKNFDFNIYFYGETNRLSVSPSYYDSWATSGRVLNDGSNVSRGFINSWTHDNQNTSTPSSIDSDYSWGNYNYKKTYFIRCRNITLGYTIPIAKNILNKFRVYFDVNNPFVITNWNGLDPETDLQLQDDKQTQKASTFAYPNVTSFNFGIDITF